MDEDNARLIGRMLGTKIELDDLDAHQLFIRLKIRFPTSKQLEPGFFYSREDGAPVWIGFKYERLSSFCCHCRILDHTIGTSYNKSPHPQKVALSEKMRGSSPLVLIGDQNTGGSQLVSTSVENWKLRNQVYFREQFRLSRR